MPIVYTYTASFNGGEVTPEFWGRLDDQKFQTGLALCQNFEVLPHGPVRNRAGLQYVGRTVGLTKSRLIPFVFRAEQAAVVEVGPFAFRFIRDGGFILNPSSLPLTVSHPYSSSELADLRYTQVGDVITFAHPNHPPAELRRTGPDTWEYVVINFGASINPPASVSTAGPNYPPTVDPDPLLYEWVVTAVDGAGEESLPSTPASALTDFSKPQSAITVSWTAVTGAVRYRVYRRQSGAYGFMTETTSLSFVDANTVAPDFTRTPPAALPPGLFSSPGQYPTAVTSHQQRVWFAATLNEPLTVWASKTGLPRDFRFSIPTVDTDSFKFRLAARDGSPVQHLVPLQDLLVLTGSAEWRVTGADSDTITPSSINARVQSYVGANRAQPLVINNVCVYAAARGGHLRQLGYSDERGGFVTLDLSLRAPHLFEQRAIVDLALSKAPSPVVWAVTSDGMLLGLTYIPEEQIFAWHRHTTKGKFESIAVIPEGDDDVLYAVILRQYERGEERTIERLVPRRDDDLVEAFFVDAGLTYRGPPTTVITNLVHLNGETVSILADGAVLPPRVVPASGVITLERPASVVHIGLPIDARVQMLPISVQAAGFGQGRFKAVNAAHLKVYRASGIFVGVSNLQPVEYKQRRAESIDAPPDLVTDEIEVVPRGRWTPHGALTITQPTPLPVTLLAVTLEVSFAE